jgi:hypothetical protein
MGFSSSGIRGHKRGKIAQSVMTIYEEKLKFSVVHILVAPTSLEATKENDKLLQSDGIEPEPIAAVINVEKHDKFHSMMAVKSC